MRIKDRQVPTHRMAGKMVTLEAERLHKAQLLRIVLAPFENEFRCAPVFGDKPKDPVGGLVHHVVLFLKLLGPVVVEQYGHQAAFAGFHS